MRIIVVETRLRAAKFKSKRPTPVSGLRNHVGGGGGGGVIT